VAADDFVHTAGDISKVCVWGSYMNLDPSEDTSYDCAADYPADSFRVRILEDNDGYPGAEVASRTVSLLNTTRVKDDTITAMDGINPEMDVYGYQLTLSPPISGLTLNQCYWLEVSNNTPDSGNVTLCEWGWLRLAADDDAGNRYAAAGNAFDGYRAGSEVHWDQAFCLDSTFAAGGCGDRTRACCSCAGACTVDELEACVQQDFQWSVDSDPLDPCGIGFSCPGAPANDLCANAEEVPVGTFSFNTGCAGTDGPNPVETDFGSDGLLKDLWYFFTVPNNPAINDATESCTLIASMCGTGTAARSAAYFDTMIAVYHNPNAPTVCPCPGDLVEQEDWKVDGNGDADGWAVDENCFKQAVGGPGFIFHAGAKPGECYTIRLGGFPGNDDAGTGTIDLSCGATFCGDGRRNGNEDCDLLDTDLCGANVACNPDCTCGPAVLCGDNIYNALYEECDFSVAPTGCAVNSNCTAQCTCTEFCGNNTIEGDEECDGTDDDACPDACIDGPGPTECTCPLRICGNGLLDFQEECEFDTDCPAGGDCRVAGDPLGECTCACAETEAVPVPTTQCTSAFLPTESKCRTRGLTFTMVPPATASGGVGTSAIKVTMIDLQNPAPPNVPAFPPPNFGAFEDATCTAPGEAGGCDRWVGPPYTFLEGIDVPTSGTYRTARLQCTPYYHDWPSLGEFTVIGAEVNPSSRYNVKAYGSSCKGNEGSCSSTSSDVMMFTRRWGDTSPNFEDGVAPLTQPDAIDISVVVNKFKSLPGAPVKAIAQVQPNLPDANGDISALDISGVVDAVKNFAYPFTGPCVCPSTVPCNTTACANAGACTGLYGANATCVRSCTAGPRLGAICTVNKHCGVCTAPSTNAGAPCDNNAQCPSGACTTGTCGTGFCRDRCSRCN
jgi:hypothetical protein